MLEKGGSALAGIDKTDPKNDLLSNLPPAIDPLASLGIDAGEILSGQFVHGWLACD